MVRFQKRPHFEVWCLLEGGAYFDLSAHGAVFIRGRRLFETRRFLEKIRYYNSFFIKQDQHSLLRMNSKYFATLMDVMQMQIHYEYLGSQVQLF